MNKKLKKRIRDFLGDVSNEFGKDYLFNHNTWEEEAFYLLHLTINEKEKKCQ